MICVSRRPLAGQPEDTRPSMFIAGLIGWAADHPRRVMWPPREPAETRRCTVRPSRPSSQGNHMLAAEFGTGQVFLSMLFFFLFFILIWLVIAIFADIFRSPDLSGWAKALWVLFVIVLPFLGVFSYLIVRGHKMRDYATAGTNRRDEVYRMYVGDLTPRP
jgi:hypothetical protein